MNIAEELRAAAMRLRERSLGTTPGPWRYHDAHLGHLGGHTATVLAGELNDTKLVAWLPSRSQEPWATHPCWANSMWAALVNPLLAEPFAALLEFEADMWEARGNSAEGSTFHALAVARVINGTSAPAPVGAPVEESAP